MGIPIGAHPRHSEIWDPIVKKCERKLFKPKKVVDRLVRLQRWVLWGGHADQKKIARVNWGSICLSKEKGGLSIEDLVKFNYALLGKGCWNLFHHQGELWPQVLESNYGAWRNLDVTRRNNRESLWWEDLSFICNSTEKGSWFKSETK